MACLAARSIAFLAAFGAAPRFMPAARAERPTTYTRTCTTSECHAGYLQRRFQHHPVASGVCRFCHRVTDRSRHTFRLVRDGAELCRQCHWERRWKSQLHAPVASGECTACHDPHGAEYESLLRKERLAELCAECHEDSWGKKARLHGPVASGECTVCHDPHSSEYRELLVTAETELCGRCHPSVDESAARSAFAHAPTRERACLQCHDPHGADTPGGLRQSIPGLCYTCHDRVQALVSKAEHDHEPLAQEGGCLQCHLPHASDVPFNLKASPPELCAACHEEEETFRSASGAGGHRGCTGCHDAHGSVHPSLLVEEFPPGIYSGFEVGNYRLCFVCHPEHKVLTKETSDLTAFRNGEVNLHYLHVNQPEKGRTCRACHDPHESGLPRRIRKSVPYGQWEIPINFEPTETGGSCRPGCHEPMSYDRERPVARGRE